MQHLRKPALLLQPVAGRRARRARGRLAVAAEALRRGVARARRSSYGGSKPELAHLGDDLVLVLRQVAARPPRGCPSSRVGYFPLVWGMFSGSAPRLMLRFQRLRAEPRPRPGTPCRSSPSTPRSRTRRAARPRSRVSAVALSSSLSFSASLRERPVGDVAKRALGEVIRARRRSSSGRRPSRPRAGAWGPGDQRARAALPPAALRRAIACARCRGGRRRSMRKQQGRSPIPAEERPTSWSGTTTGAAASTSSACSATCALGRSTDRWEASRAILGLRRADQPGRTARSRPRS